MIFVFLMKKNMKGETELTEGTELGVPADGQRAGGPAVWRKMEDGWWPAGIGDLKFQKKPMILRKLNQIRPDQTAQSMAGDGWRVTRLEAQGARRKGRLSKLLGRRPALRVSTRGRAARAPVLADDQRVTGGMWHVASDKVRGRIGIHDRVGTCAKTTAQGLGDQWPLASISLY